MKLNKLLIIIGFILFNLTSGCKAEPKAVGVDCSTDGTLGLTVPDIVLVGTDVVGFESFHKSQEQLSKTYSAEIGGAKLALSLDVHSEYLSIIRTFNEPSQVVNTRTYNVCNTEDRLGSDQLHIRVVNNGLLVLETESKVDGIPDDLWILYDKKN